MQVQNIVYLKDSEPSTIQPTKRKNQKMRHTTGHVLIKQQRDYKSCLSALALWGNKNKNSMSSKFITMYRS